MLKGGCPRPGQWPGHGRGRPGVLAGAFPELFHLFCQPRPAPAIFKCIYDLICHSCLIQHISERQKAYIFFKAERIGDLDQLLPPSVIKVGKFTKQEKGGARTPASGRGYWPGHFQNFSAYFASPGQPRPSTIGLQPSELFHLF